MDLNKWNIRISDASHVLLRKAVVLAFSTVTTALFFYLNEVQPHYYIDEMFHVPQTLRFCRGNFHEWDQKITTFPGLYLIAIAVLAPFNLCTITWLRGVNLAATLFNFYVVYELIKFASENRGNNKKGKKIDQKNKWARLLRSLNIALLPPLYFLLFLYYTDVVSTNVVLLMYLFYLRKNFRASALTGVLAVLVRQTNIVWVAWLSIERAMDIIENKNPERVRKVCKNSPAYIRLLWDNAYEELTRGRLFNLVSEILGALFPYIIIGLGFLLFVILNKGIVLGDRTAHVATLHVPQILYYSVFVSFFSWPYFLPYVNDYAKIVRNRPVLAGLAFATMGAIVRYNTLVHPYLLADNRHYTFYVWNRVIGRHYLAKYALVPVYGFCLYSIWRGVNHLRFLSAIGYFATVFVVLVPQLLLEPRYFFIPYIIFRVNMRNPKPWQILAEFLSAVAVNGFQFFVFTNKVFYWDDDVHPQRISW